MLLQLLGNLRLESIYEIKEKVLLTYVRYLKHEAEESLDVVLDGMIIP